VKLIAPRLPVVVVVATAVNLLLFSAMEAMVRQDRVRLSQAEQVEIANFIRMGDLASPPDTRRDAEAPPKPRAEEQARINRLVDSVGGNAGAAQMPAHLDFDFGDGLGGVGGVGSGAPPAVRMASDLVILVRVPPVYPRAALVRGVEGYVDVLFTVTETGTVANVSILAAEPPGMFERETLEAVARWRFQPEIRSGRPVAIPVRTRLRFELNEPSR